MPDAGHPLVRAAQEIFVGSNDREAWANIAAEAAEARLSAARQVGPTTPDEAYADALQAAARSVTIAQREYPSVESLRWKEAAFRELESLARARFGAKQVIVSLGYEPMPTPASGWRPRGRLLGKPI